MAKMQNIPKTLWEAIAMKKHPEVLELRERLRPLSKLKSYSRNIVSGKKKLFNLNYFHLTICLARTEAKPTVAHQTVLQLIMEYLEHEGYSKVIQAIEEESNVKCII